MLWTVGPFVRCYISKGNVKPFFEVNSSFGRDKTKIKSSDNYGYQSSEDEYIENVSIYGGWFGMATSIGKRASFDFMAGYSSLIYKEKEVLYNERTVTGTFGIRIGFTMYLGGKD
tara:strand:- start:1 stop:345 length:345 start_codon:yes stop_codon:yes gene_type:complete